MKKLLFNNIGYKLLAIVLAVLLWLVVVNITDYTVTVKIEDIPVEQLNSDVLEELDQIYDVVKGDTVDIYVKGRRSVVSNLTAKNFYAYAGILEDAHLHHDFASCIAVAVDYGICDSFGNCCFYIRKLCDVGVKDGEKSADCKAGKALVFRECGECEVHFVKWSEGRSAQFSQPPFLCIYLLG